MKSSLRRNKEQSHKRRDFLFFAGRNKVDFRNIYLDLFQMLLQLRRWAVDA